MSSTEWNRANREKSRGYCRAYYYRNHNYMLGRSKARRLSQRPIIDWVIAYKASVGCLDCGEKNPIVLEFDHRDRKTKRKGGVSQLAHHADIDRVKEEIAKCDVRCANCHRIKTHKERMNGLRND